LKAGVYSFSLKDKLGCVKTDSVALGNYPRPQFQIIPKLPCVNGSEYGIGSLQLKAQKFDSLRWGFSRFGLQETTTLVGVPKGEYTMWVRDKLNCDYTEKVKLQARTPLEVTLPADTLINLGDSFRLNPTVLNGTDSMRFRWNPPVYLSCDTCQNPWTKPLNEILYRLNVQNKEGCQNNATMLIRVEKNQKVFIPNVFSPNNDGTNEFFIPYTRNAKRIQMLRIFNRWGELVFENKDFVPNEPSLGWDGLFKGQTLKSDVFVYYVEVLFESGDVGIFKGDVTLMR
jgi:gliding motility-associated-like protein